MQEQQSRLCLVALIPGRGYFETAIHMTGRVFFLPSSDGSSKSKWLLQADQVQFTLRTTPFSTKIKTSFLPLYGHGLHQHNRYEPTSFRWLFLGPAAPKSHRLPLPAWQLRNCNHGRLDCRFWQYYSIEPNNKP